ncbi:hypothetical protein OsJ_12283 [Oryza sativa Japonica Group]|uniref:Pentatricopeptide repeat-containing protein n=1 Tax=Oryza sativa subsp. japonica TaxID=39947 RepID=B9FB39_ORYSJ|nr:hypothetical protein OsJ_12283 [Oryza sativa Japonica Group]
MCRYSTGSLPESAAGHAVGDAAFSFEAPRRRRGGRGRSPRAEQRSGGVDGCPGEVGHVVRTRRGGGRRPTDPPPPSDHQRHPMESPPPRPPRPFKRGPRSRADVLQLFGEMNRSGCEGNAESMAVALSACPYAGDLALAKGEATHGCGVMKGVIHGYVFITNSLVCMYGKLGEMDNAKKAFRDATEKNIVTWNTLITSYATAGLCDEALDVLAQMEQIGGTVAPNVLPVNTTRFDKLTS